MDRGHAHDGGARRRWMAARMARTIGPVTATSASWKVMARTNWAENSHLPFRRRDRAMLRFRQMRSLKKFVAVHSYVRSRQNGNCRNRRRTDPYRRRPPRRRRGLEKRCYSNAGDARSLSRAGAGLAEGSRRGDAGVAGTGGSSGRRFRLAQDRAWLDRLLVAHWGMIDLLPENHLTNRWKHCGSKRAKTAAQT